jgi:hypothetical protein
LTPRLANSRFWPPLRGTPWCPNSRTNLFKIGYHTSRHSFISNRRSAIESFSLAAGKL